MTASGDRGDPPSTDPVSTVSRWVDNNLQLVRGAMSAVVFGSALASVFLLRRAVREAREALTLSTNADVVKLIESMRSSTPVTLTVRVEGVTATGHIRVTHNPWWKRWVVIDKSSSSAAGSHDASSASAMTDTHDLGSRLTHSTPQSMVSHTSASSTTTVDSHDASQRAHAIPAHSTSSDDKPPGSESLHSGGIVLWPFGVDRNAPKAAEWLQEHIRRGATAHIVPLVATHSTTMLPPSTIGSKIKRGDSEQTGATGERDCVALHSVTDHPVLHCSVSTTHTASLRRRWFRSDLSTDVLRLGLSRFAQPLPSQSSSTIGHDRQGSETEKAVLLVSEAEVDKRRDTLLTAEADAKRAERGVWKESPPPQSRVGWIVGMFRRMVGRKS